MKKADPGTERTSSIALEQIDAAGRVEYTLDILEEAAALVVRPMRGACPLHGRAERVPLC